MVYENEKRENKLSMMHIDKNDDDTRRKKQKNFVTKNELDPDSIESNAYKTKTKMENINTNLFDCLWDQIGKNGCRSTV